MRIMIYSKNLITYIFLLIILIIFTYCGDNSTEQNQKPTDNQEQIDHKKNNSTDIEDQNKDKDNEKDTNSVKENHDDKDSSYKKTNLDQLLKVNYQEKKFYLKKAGNFYTRETPESELPPDNYYIIYLNENGRRVKEEELKNGLIINTIIRKYYDSGELNIKAEFGENLSPKNVTVYNKQSIVTRKEIYLRGKITFITFYNDDGKKIRDENYSNGIIRNAENYQGEVITKEEFYNQNGKPDGWWIYRNDDAVKIKEELYQNGKIEEYIIYKYNQKSNKIREERYIGSTMVEYFTYEYTSDYIIQERYALDETDPEQKKYLLMDIIRYEK